MTDLRPLGLDVAKATSHACLVRHSGKLRRRAFANTAAGFSQLSEWLEKQGAERAHACVEATGTYYEALAAYLHGEGHAVSVVNPLKILR